MGAEYFGQRWALTLSVIKLAALNLCLHHASMIIEHFIIQLMHNIQYVDTIKIIKYLKVLQHVSDHRGSITREPFTVFG